MPFTRRIIDEIWEDAEAAKIKSCRKETKRRFKALREPGIPAEVVALDLLRRRCSRCASNARCWAPG
jgi:hypothetical protein